MLHRLRLPLLALCALSLPATAALAAKPDKKDAATHDHADAAAPKPSGDTLDAMHKHDMAAAAEAGWVEAPVEERQVTTHHVATTHAGAMKYSATAGTLTIRDDDAKPIASIFYVAYTADGVKNESHRPVTFFYNGGPGSSSLWLNMGSFAPERVQTGNPEYIKPAPYQFGPNPDTLLDKTDMVFIDAPGTGYSRPLGDATEKQFWGVDQDADAFARAIMRYVTENARWQSPKFLFGESYGTTRSGALSYLLQDRGMALNGVILLSSVMNYGRQQPGLDRNSINYLPSYAAAAWYHHKVANPTPDVASWVERAREFAAGPYEQALEQGDALDPAMRQKIATEMSALIGIPVQYILDANLRVDLGRFRAELLRDQRLTIGRYDDRYTGINPDAAGESPEYDASDTAISGAFIASFHDYMTNVLGYKTEMPYRVSVYGMDGFKWDFTHHAPGGNSHYPQAMPDVAVDLGAALRTNPYLHVLSMNGYYDLATPFFGTEYDLHHMELDPAQARNVEFAYFPSGHMAYLNPEARTMMHKRLSAFYDQVLSEAENPNPPVPPTLAAGG